MHRKLTFVPAAAAVLAGLLTGCGVIRPGVVDRVDEVSVAGGTCRIEWWLSGLTDAASEEAWRVARDALTQATVSSDDFDGWLNTLTTLDDTEWASTIELNGAVHREAIRADVRDALTDAGYPDEERVIETYSAMRCTPTPGT